MAGRTLAILLLVFAVSFMDRQLLAILIEPIRKELAFSDTAAGQETLAAGAGAELERRHLQRSHHGRRDGERVADRGDDPGPGKIVATFAPGCSRSR